MDQRIKNISLSFSCQENWDSMKPGDDNSRFCEKCQHVVLDFSNATKAEFEEKVKNSQGHVCGRFKKSQMSSGFLKYAAATAIVASSLNAIGCAPEIIEPVTPKPSANKNIPASKSYVMGRFRY